jgi:predicted short-subunit dehydrogenase-like oxidoreductase (DUF2520 family)
MFSLEGTRQGIDLFQPYLERLGARSFIIAPEIKPLYHVVCTMSSNLVIGLLTFATQLGSETGIPASTLTDLVTGLANETVGNALKKKSISDALSGPIERGDMDTIKQHLEALGDFPEQKELYVILSLKVLEAARLKGTDPEILRRLEETLSRSHDLETKNERP